MFLMMNSAGPRTVIKVLTLGVIIQSATGSFCPRWQGLYMSYPSTFRGLNSNYYAEKENLMEEMEDVSPDTDTLKRVRQVEGNVEKIERAFANGAERVELTTAACEHEQEFVDASATASRSVTKKEPNKCTLFFIRKGKNLEDYVNEYQDLRMLPKFLKELREADLHSLFDNTLTVMVESSRRKLRSRSGDIVEESQISANKPTCYHIVSQPDKALTPEEIRERQHLRKKFILREQEKKAQEAAKERERLAKYGSRCQEELFIYNKTRGGGRVEFCYQVMLERNSNPNPDDHCIECVYYKKALMRRLR